MGRNSVYHLLPLRGINLITPRLTLYTKANTTKETMSLLGQSHLHLDRTHLHKPRHKLCFPGQNDITGHLHHLKTNYSVEFKSNTSYSMQNVYEHCTWHHWTCLQPQNKPVFKVILHIPCTMCVGIAHIHHIYPLNNEPRHTVKHSLSSLNLATVCCHQGGQDFGHTTVLPI